MTSTATPATATGIGALAARFGLAAHVLRHWESVGLLTPDRDPAGRRRYGPAEERRVAVILRAKKAGLGLEAIRLLVDAEGSTDRRAVLEAEADALRARIAAATAALEIVECALGCERDDVAACPHFNRLVAADAAES
ncbi:MerR family transcriptional regulator [Yinghuangia seranimata]|uniref:MerR family transcriptional regulator n=1 Tax=Yinghuangia seranimata TaxID=408067 RepID=UPI00248C8587|nr:MerR family transcriptional regulator [Yinghuangia seranimata]MDI2131038.1 MerR family transcriptional regulator [Yinghuangia seranimata]